MTTLEKTRDWNVAMLDNLPDDGVLREIIDGELRVTPLLHRWLHVGISDALADRLQSYLEGHRAGHVLGFWDLVRFDDYNGVLPDVFVLPFVNGRPARSYQEAGRILLVVEVLSPASARADRYDKRRLYQKHGVVEYWVVDTDAAIVERWRPGDERPEVLADRIVWHPEGVAEPLVLDIKAIIED